MKTIKLTSKQSKELIKFLEQVYYERNEEGNAGSKWFDKDDDLSYGPSALLNQLTNDSYVLNNLSFHND